MTREQVSLEQVEAMARLAGVRDENALRGILEMVEEYAQEKGRRNVFRNERGNDACVCVELEPAERDRLSALRLFKKCSRCHEKLDRAAFYRDMNKRDGLRGTCKECERVLRMRRRRGKRGVATTPKLAKEAQGG